VLAKIHTEGDRIDVEKHVLGAEAIFESIINAAGGPRTVVPAV
jgi:hypothetical protein